MHRFTELVDGCATFTLETLRYANERTIEQLQTSSATSLLKTLQMVQLQKTIFAVGMFSIFEANLQEGLSCSDGFGEAKKILEGERLLDLKEHFDDLFLAINVLKHGRGRSYDVLVEKAEDLPFRIKLPEQPFFFEGDVSEVSTLVQVDDAFVLLCGKVISDVSGAIARVRPEFAFV